MAQEESVQQFDEKSVQEAIALARAHHEESNAARASAAGEAATLNLADDGHLQVAAQCVNVAVTNHKVCIGLPLGIGRVCLPVPGFVPNGKVAQACISICTTFGIPTGVRLTVSVGNQVILKKTFGKC